MVSWWLHPRASSAHRSRVFLSFIRLAPYYQRIRNIKMQSLLHRNPRKHLVKSSISLQARWHDTIRHQPCLPLYLLALLRATVDPSPHIVTLLIKAGSGCKKKPQSTRTPSPKILTWGHYQESDEGKVATLARPFLSLLRLQRKNVRSSIILNGFHGFGNLHWGTRWEILVPHRA